MTSSEFLIEEGSLVSSKFSCLGAMFWRHFTFTLEKRLCKRGVSGVVQEPAEVSENDNEGSTRTIVSSYHGYTVN